MASFKNFDERGKAGESLNVVFLGGSLTWGANATDPNKTSYRARMGRYLQERYPEAHVNVHDAAIGGTGSQLGMFRLDRDVLAHNPDLVFVEYSVNDNCKGNNPEVLWSYEHILRRLVGKGIAVEIVLLGVKEVYAASADLNEVKRRLQHLRLAEAYHTAVGDTYPLIRAKVASGELDLNIMYPFEAVHPDDLGYEQFYLAARQGFEQAVAADTTCVLPAQPVFEGPYTVVERHRLNQLPLPAGWKTEKNYRISLWFDGLPSRWQDGVIACDASHADSLPLTFTFSGSFVGLFGEANDVGLGFKATIDGKPIGNHGEDHIWRFDTAGAGFSKGQLFRWQVLSSNLPEGEHTLVIQPVKRSADNKGQLRIESICTASRIR